MLARNRNPLKLTQAQGVMLIKRIQEYLVEPKPVAQPGLDMELHMPRDLTWNLKVRN